MGMRKISQASIATRIEAFLASTVASDPPVGPYLRLVYT